MYEGGFSVKKPSELFERMMRHLVDFPDDTPVTIQVQEVGGYSLTITLGMLRWVYRILTILEDSGRIVA